MSQLRVKILLIGDSSVGKSSLVTQYVDEYFQQGHTPTIGVEYKQKTIELPDHAPVRVQLWDTAGTQRFRTITPIYYKNVDGVLIVYDITDEKSFETIDYWIGQLNENADVANLQMLIVGNKTDLAQKRTVKQALGNEVAGKMGIDYYETSATDFQSTSNAFDSLIRKILKHKRKEVGISFKLSKPQKKMEKKNSDCC